MIINYGGLSSSPTAPPKIFGLGFMVITYGGTVIVTVGDITLGLSEIAGVPQTYPGIKGSTTFEQISGPTNDMASLVGSSAIEVVGVPNQYPTVTAKG